MESFIVQSRTQTSYQICNRFIILELILDYWKPYSLIRDSFTVINLGIKSNNYIIITNAKCEQNASQ